MCTVTPNKNIYVAKCSTERQKWAAVYHVQIFIYLTFSGFFSLLHALRVSATFQLGKPCTVVCCPFCSDTEREKFPMKRTSSPAHQEASYLWPERENIFSLRRAGVNPPQLVKSLQGLYFWDIKRQLVWASFSSPIKPFVTGDTPPSGIFQCFSNRGHAQCTWPCSKTGCTAPGKEWTNTENYVSFQAFLLCCMERLLWLSTTTFIRSPFFFLFTLVN